MLCPASHFARSRESPITTNPVGHRQPQPCWDGVAVCGEVALGKRAAPRVDGQSRPLPLRLHSYACRFLSQDTLDFFEKYVRNTAQLYTGSDLKDTANILQLSVASVKRVVGLPPHKTLLQLSERLKTNEALGLTHPPPYSEHHYRPVPCTDPLALSSR